MAGIVLNSAKLRRLDGRIALLQNIFVGHFSLFVNNKVPAPADIFLDYTLANEHTNHGYGDDRYAFLNTPATLVGGNLAFKEASTPFGPYINSGVTNWETMYGFVWWVGQSRTLGPWFVWSAGRFPAPITLAPGQHLPLTPQWFGGSQY